MAILWTVLYVIIALVVIWWVLGQAKKLDQSHGGGEHGQEHHHDSEQPDDLTKINGIGPVIAPRLKSLGITSFRQIAALTPTDVEHINKQLDFKGRIERERWVEQAKALLNDHQ